MRFNRRTILSGAIAAASILASHPAAAQGNFPTKPITIIVPAAAGGPTDTVARLIGEAMGRTLGQTILVENVGGAGGTIGMARASKSALTATRSPSGTSRTRPLPRFTTPSSTMSSTISITSAALPMCP